MLIPAPLIALVRASAITSSFPLVVRAMASTVDGSGGGLSLFGTKPIVSAEEVLAVVGDDAPIRFVDASWYLPAAGRDAAAEFKECRIKGAVFFDIDEIADTTSKPGLPHMLPKAKQLSEAVTEMGIRGEDSIVVYTHRDCFSAARCWWTFKAMSHDKVHVLDGGLEAWRAAGGEVESGEPTGGLPGTGKRKSKPLVQPKGNAYLLDKKLFPAKLRPEYVSSLRQVESFAKSNSAQGGKGGDGTQMADARSQGRFVAEEPEPRPGLRGGHVPGSKCVPFSKILQEGDWTRFRSAEVIRQVFEEAGIDIDSEKGPLITSCGSGVTGAVLTLGLHIAGRDASLSPLYDGSWAEYGGKSDTLIST